MIIGKWLRRVAAWLVAPVMFFAAATSAPAAHPNITVLAFGLFGAQSVFESEAKRAADIVAQRAGTKAVEVHANTKTRADVSVASIAATLRSAAQHMDRADDVLFLILTSHGSQDGVVVQAGRRVQLLSPAALADMLNAAGVRHRVVVVSACYSGVFLAPLAGDDTLVITAADADHSSFGCQDKVKWTYFGDAFFNRAVRDAPDLRSAFAEARRLVGKREKQYGLVPSNPQIAGGKDIDITFGEKRGEAASARKP